MTQKVTANYVDIVNKAVFAADIYYNRTIEKIEKLADGPQDGLLYCVPGLVDSHVHIESSMLTPQKFAEMVIPHGTIGVVCDPHEIVNVLGMPGMEYMMEDADKSPLNFYFAVPSCVPATPFETSGAVVTAADILKVIDKSVALAEMMNYPGVCMRLPEVMDKLNVAIEAGKPIDGHAPGLDGKDLELYASAGISTDHECFSLDEALKKIALGMKVLIREGSAARNLDALFPLMKSNPESVMACTDDAHPDDIRARGHIEKFYRRAVAEGVSVFDIFRILTLNPIEHYKLDCGALRIGDKADFVMVSDLEKYDVCRVYLAGKKVYENGKQLYRSIHSQRPNNFAKRNFYDFDFAVNAPKDAPTVKVIDILPGELVTKQSTRMMYTKKGDPIEAVPDADIVKIAVVNRYSNAPVVNGFIRGTGLKRGAMASSVAHDSHNVVVIGADSNSMLKAVESIFRSKGGIVVVPETGEPEELKLPIAGLMSGKDHNAVADQYEALIAMAKEKLGVTLESPFMTMAFMSLLVIPDLKIGDKGLFDVTKFEFTDLFV